MSHRLVVNTRREKCDVYVGRPTKWGNPFILGADGNRADVVRKYAEWLPTQAGLMASLGELRGKVLGCYCAPDDCHADVLARLANRSAEALELFDSPGRRP